MQRYETVDAYIEGHPEWKSALLKLRKILTATDLEEVVKWGAPCYTIGGKNVVGMAAFQGYVGLWFHQGVMLSDPEGVLINAQEGKTKALRQWRFDTASEIKVTKVRAYVQEAIANQRAGKEVQPDRNNALVVPAELTKALGKRAKAKRAFAALTKGKQREYAEYITSAKREATKVSRLERIVPMIEAGVGLNDKYRNC